MQKLDVYLGGLGWALVNTKSEKRDPMCQVRDLISRKAFEFIVDVTDNFSLFNSDSALGLPAQSFADESRKDSVQMEKIFRLYGLRN